MKLAILKRSFFTTILQPAFIFCLVVETATVLFLIFGIKIESYQDTFVSITLLGWKIDQVSSFVNQILPDFIQIIIISIVFLFTLVVSTIYPELVGNSMLTIVLTKPVTRRGLLLSEFAGAGMAMCVDIFVFLASVALVLLVKTGKLFLVEFLGGTISFCTLLVLIFALAQLFGAIGEKASTSEVLILSIFLILSPLIHSENANKTLLINIVSLIVPSTNPLVNTIQSSLAGISISPVTFVQPLLIAAICVVASVIIFERKDF